MQLQKESRFFGSEVFCMEKCPAVSKIAVSEVNLISLSHTLQSMAMAMSLFWWKLHLKLVDFRASYSYIKILYIESVFF